jgi:hypothetical protein
MLVVAACGHGGSTVGTRGDSASHAADHVAASPRIIGEWEEWSGREPETAPHGNTADGVRFAQWVLSTDPERRYVLDAFVRDDRVLGVVLNHVMTRAQVDSALRTLLSGMQERFPDRALDVVAYYRSGDPLARLAWEPGAGDARLEWPRLVWRQ